MSNLWDFTKANPVAKVHDMVDHIMQTTAIYAIGCDLDGTLCDVTWRQHHAKLRQWDAFHGGIPNDTPHMPVLLVVRSFLSHGTPVVFFTGRPERYRADTVRWLEENYLPANYLFMRADLDRRQDTVVKEEQYRLYQQQYGWPLMFVLEDRNAVVAMWRSLGVPCFQVREAQY